MCRLKKSSSPKCRRRRLPCGKKKRKRRAFSSRRKAPRRHCPESRSERRRPSSRQAKKTPRRKRIRRRKRKARTKNVFPVTSFAASGASMRAPHAARTIPMCSTAGISTTSARRFRRSRKSAEKSRCAARFLNWTRILSKRAAARSLSFPSRTIRTRLPRNSLCAVKARSWTA